MKAILEFTLPEEKEDHQAALKGSSAIEALKEIYNTLFRTRLKYKDLPDEVNKEIELMREEFLSTLNEWEVEI